MVENRQKLNQAEFTLESKFQTKVLLIMKVVFYKPDRKLDLAEWAS